MNHFNEERSSRSGFVTTEIGETPEEWEVALLNDIADDDSDIVAGPFGSNLKVEEYKPEGVPIIRLQNIDRNLFINKNIKYVSPEKADELSYHSFRDGDIVLAKLGDPIGKACIVPPSIRRGIVVADVVRIRLPQTKASHDYVVQVLNSSSIRRQLRMQTIGSTRPRVNITQVRNLRFSLPPIDEQQKISSILSTVDDAIQKTDEVIEKSRQLKKGLMQQLLTKGIGHTKFKKTGIGEIPEEWEVDTIPSLLNIIDYRGRTPPFSRSGIPYVGSDNIRDERMTLDSKRFVSEDTYDKYMTRGIPNPGDILLTTEAPLGEVALVPKNFRFCFAQRLVALQCRKHFSSTFFMYMLRSDIVQKQLRACATGTTAIGISSRNMKFIRIPYSEDAEEQQRIASILSNMDDKFKREEEYKAELERVKRGLMQVLLTGKIRVKVNT